jgi:hypothetical protein
MSGLILSIMQMSFAQSSQSAANATSATLPRRNSAAEIARPAVEQPGLPRVLIIGDSISIGYTTPTRKLLDGKFNVYRPPINCGPTTRGLVYLDQWLGNEKWDIIQFNFGLHDLGYVDKKGIYDISGVQRVPRRQYKQNLEKIVERLEKTGALLIWASTTPVPAGSPGRFQGDDLHYNRIAAEIMQRHGIATNDLHAAAMDRLMEIQLPQNVHYHYSGYEYLAEHVARFIEEAWQNKSKKNSGHGVEHDYDHQLALAYN